MFALEIYWRERKFLGIRIRGKCQGRFTNVARDGRDGVTSPKSSILLSHVLVRIPPCSPEELKKNIGFGLKGGTQGRRGIL